MNNNKKSNSPKNVHASQSIEDDKGSCEGYGEFYDRSDRIYREQSPCIDSLGENRYNLSGSNAFRIGVVEIVESAHVLAVDHLVVMIRGFRPSPFAGQRNRNEIE